RTLQFDQFRWFAEIEPARDPFRLFAFDAFAIEQIDSTIKLQQHAAERIQFLREFRLELERTRGDPPFVAGKQSFRGHLLANELRGFGGGRGVQCVWDGFHDGTLSVDGASVKMERMKAENDE